MTQHNDSPSERAAQGSGAKRPSEEEVRQAGGKRRQPGPDQEQATTILKNGFGRQDRKLIQLMDELRACGTSLDVDIPTIAILGNQSSGKSSVIEAISGIALPRASGTCTRCPTEVRLVRKNCQWRCKISLRFEKDGKGASKDKVEEIPFGNDILDPLSVTDRLRRAQYAILSATNDISGLLSANLEDLKKPNTAFSENTVCVSIYGPDCINLSFIDLPGLIVYAGEGENQTDIKTIERMARNAVGRQNCIILLTIPCTDDIQNQSGATLARAVDPQGTRTIGVLTKPDLIQEDDHDAWLEILSGKTHRLRLGYYAVRNSGPKDLQAGVSNAAARKREAHFFSQEPWSTPLFKGRLGTACLAQKLSDLLERTIEKKLPGLVSLIQNKLLQAQQELKKIPPPIEKSNAPLHVLRLCQNVASAISAMKGEQPTSPAFNQRLQTTAFSKFARQLRQSEPVFFVADKGDQEHPWSAVSNASLYAIRTPKKYTGNYLSANDELAEEDFGTKQRIVFTLEEVREMKVSSTGFELPGNLAYGVKTQLIKSSIEHWPHLAQQCFTSCKNLFREELEDIVQDQFGCHKAGGLHRQAKGIAEELQNECEADLQRDLERLLGPEMAFVYTNKGEDFLQEKEKVLAELCSKRPGHKGLDSLSVAERHQVRGACATLKEQGFKSITEASLSKDLFNDDFGEELNICAEVLAYYQLAARRVVDSVPMTVVFHYIDAVGQRLQDELMKQLGVYGDGAAAKCAALLAEDPELTEKRAELHAQSQRLTQSLHAVRNFGAA